MTVEQSNTTPVAGITVTLSTALAGNSPEGVITTQVTNASGVVTFNNLPSTGQLCVSATTGSGNSLQATGTCLQPFPATLTLAF